jgi:erythromycin esterase-like protein
MAAHPITGAPDDDDGLMALVGDRRLVLIGEASYGTHEFDRERARVTRRLIDELGFTVVAVEGDWPDADRVNRYVRGVSGDADADSSLQGFLRCSHYVEARLSQQFDAVIHLDRTRAPEPLERTVRWEVGEPAETYPTGL